MPRTAEDNQRIRDEQRVRILAAARRVFARKGLAATVDDVAMEAGVSHGLAYRYFSNKEALFAELVAQDLQSPRADLRSEDLPGTPGERLRAVISGFVEGRRERPEQYLLLDQALSGEHTPPGLRELIRERGRAVQALLRQLIIEGQASGEVASGNPDELIRALLACFDGLTRWAANHPDQYRENFPSADIFIRMLKPDSKI